MRHKLCLDEERATMSKLLFRQVENYDWDGVCFKQQADKNYFKKKAHITATTWLTS